MMNRTVLVICWMWVWVGWIQVYAAELPNVLIIMSDDHAAYVSGTYGNEKARTPRIDRLAKSGIKFTNAYANSPMCTPSRQSLLTGKLPHSIEVTQLTTPLPDKTITLAEVMKDNGYATAAIGKMHFNSQLTHGFDLRLDLNDHRRYLNDHPAKPVPEGIETLGPWQPFRDPAAVWLNGSYLPFGHFENDDSGTWFARQAQRFLRENRRNPFFMIVSFYEPHSPFRFPVEYRDLYDPAGFDVPRPGPEDSWQIPDIFRTLTDEQKQRIIASYYTSTHYMDTNVGRVLDTLDETGLSENTLVIYLGDHGYSLGHHGRFEKHTHFEESVRAPLIVRMPGSSRFDVAIDALVEFIDLFPTVTEFCGIEPPAGIEGQSLLSLLNGTTNEGRSFVFSEYYDNEEAMIRTREFKFIYQTGKRERQDGYKTGYPLRGRTRLLYDLRNDPHETVNLAHYPDFRDSIVDFERKMLERFAATHPAASSIPQGLSLEDQLDYYLTYREEKKHPE